MDLVSSKVRGVGGLASQDIFQAVSGTYTGVTSTEMLKSFGTKLSIVGHSERRKLGETNQMISEKVRSALKSGITPLLCVGEDVHDAEGSYFEVLREQITSSLNGIKKTEEAKRLIIAYEPVWAIGEKADKSIEPLELSQTVIFIKKVLTEVFGRKVADHIPVLYGGSVDDSNAEALVNNTGINGFLVGRASLNPEMFAKIAQILTK
jgi:triosephosphate isomerase